MSGPKRLMCKLGNCPDARRAPHARYMMSPVRRKGTNLKRCGAKQVKGVPFPESEWPLSLEHLHHSHINLSELMTGTHGAVEEDAVGGRWLSLVHTLNF